MDYFREIKKQIVLSRERSVDFSPHIHDDIELIYVIHGGCEAYCDGRRYIISNGDFFLVFPNQVHHYCGCRGDGDYILLIIKSSELAGYKEVFSRGTPLFPVCSGEAETASLLIQSVSEYEKNGVDDVLSAYLTLVFAKLLKSYRIEKNVGAGDIMHNILQYCQLHYRENLTTDTIAQNLHISRSHISHIFSKKLKTNFCDYINSLRLSDATLLLKTDISITEISEQCGFGTIRSFNRAFCKRFGTTPTKYRSDIRKQN